MAEKEPPSFYDIVWAVAIRQITMHNNEAYNNLIEDKDFLGRLRENPSDLEPEEIKSKLIKEFLNKWGCRINQNEHDNVSERIKAF